MGIPAGRRNTLVTIEKSKETQPIGEQVLTWSALSPWWAEKLPRGGSEGAAGGQVAYATRSNTWRGGWINGVHEGMRLNERGVFHDIDVVDDTGRQQNVLVVHTTQRNTVS